MDLGIQNPWWRNPKAIEDDEKVRGALEKSPKVMPVIGTGENTIILGPRQVGKTTAIKLAIRGLLEHEDPRNVLYFSCEPLNEKNDIINVVSEFDRVSAGAGKKFIFLDEVTQISGWELAVKYFLETSLGRNKVLIATGSNAMMLKSGSERLPGRNVKTKLFLSLGFRGFVLNFGSDELKKRLSGSELKKFEPKEIAAASRDLLPFTNELNRHLHIYLKTGGYLKAIYEFFERGRISEDTYEIFVKWVVGDLGKIDKKEAIFKSMVRGILKNYCSKFSLLSFSKEMDIPSHATVADYLEVLQGLMLVNNLYQVDLPKLLPVFRKERKCYFTDPFFYSVFSGYVSGKYQDYSEGDESRVLEGVVCEALARRRRRDLDVSNFLWFFLGKKETDFVLNHGRPSGIELKWQEKTSPGDFTNFYSFKQRILLSKKDFEAGDVLILPVALFLALL